MAKKTETDLMERILEEHRRNPHPGVKGGRLRLHVAIHTVVETQILEGKPGATAVTLARLQQEGLSRHDAVHAIGTVVSSEMFEVMQEGKVYEEQRYVAGLRALSAESFLSGRDVKD